MPHGMPGETRRPNGSIFTTDEARQGQEASTCSMGSRAMPGGPRGHTRIVEEAWRGQEASKSLKGRRLGQGP